MRLLGAVLAGGRSSRFGSDKALALLRGRPLIDHAADALRPHVAQLVLSGRDAQGFVGVPDRPEPGLGPLGGIAGALHYAAAHGYAAILTTGCDMPVFPPSLVRALIGGGPALTQGQPLAAFWPATLADKLDTWLATSDDRSIAAWARHVCARRVPWPGPPLPNINYIADLETLAASGEDGATGAPSHASGRSRRHGH